MPSNLHIFNLLSPVFKPEAAIPKKRYLVKSINLYSAARHPVCFQLISSSLGNGLQKKLTKAPTQTTSPFSCLLTSQQGPAKQKKACDSLRRASASPNGGKGFKLNFLAILYSFANKTGSEYNGISDLPCFKCVIIGPYLIYHDHLLYCVKDLLVTSPPIHVHGRAMYMAKLETVT